MVESSGDWRSFHETLGPRNLPDVGVKYLVVLKELLDRMFALMYGLEWGVCFIDMGYGLDIDWDNMVENCLTDAFSTMFKG